MILILRMVFRAATENFSDIEIVAINDLLEPDYLAYMLKYDSVHGRFKGDIAVDGNTLIVNGKKIRLTAERDPANLKWNDVGANSKNKVSRAHAQTHASNASEASKAIKAS